MRASTRLSIGMSLCCDALRLPVEAFSGILAALRRGSMIGARSRLSVIIRTSLVVPIQVFPNWLLSIISLAKDSRVQVSHRFDGDGRVAHPSFDLLEGLKNSSARTVSERLVDTVRDKESLLRFDLHPDPLPELLVPCKLL